MDIRDILETSLREAGVSACGFLSGESLNAACKDLDRAKRIRYGLGEARGAAVVALAYGESSETLPWTAAYPGPLSKIARFARANWYAELSARLAGATEGARRALGDAGIDPGPERSWRRLVNSGLPEKRLALEAGLGSLGRNCLVMLPSCGSAAVLGLLLCPHNFPDSRRPTVSSPASGASPAAFLDPDCRSCGECVAACPTGALRGDGSLERELCLQHWSGIPGPLSPRLEATWGDRLYGCESCQEACPRFRPDHGGRTERGFLGAGLPASWLASAPETEIRALLRGSALGMGWISIEALKRNARHLTDGY